MEKRRFHIVIASVVFAMVTWAAVNMRNDYTVAMSLPVVLENLPEGKALRYPVPKNMTVRLRGRGWVLAGLYLSPVVKYFIDVSSLSESKFVITGQDLLEHVKLSVPLQVVDVKPDTLLLALGEYREKRVPILPRLMMSYHDGYGQVGALRIMPESVLVGGSDELLDLLNGWHTAYRKFDDIRVPIETEIPLEESPYYSLQIFQSAVLLEVNVQPFAEKVIAGIPVLVTSVPPNREVIFIPPRLDLIVRGGIEQLARLNPAEFQASISYETLIADSIQSVVPDLQIPPDIKVVNKKPERFQFIIRKRL